MRSLLLLALCAAVALSAAVPKSDVEAQLTNKLKVLVDEKWNKAVGKAERPEMPGKANGFAYAVDVIASGTQSAFNCIYNFGYNLAFLRIYGPTGNGAVDTTGVQNVYYATNAGLAYEVFVTPATNNAKSGGTQFTEAYNYATQQGLRLNRIWLQVTSPINWSTSTTQNVNLINSFISTASSYGISVGIYTNWYDWLQITGNSNSVRGFYGLWYWHAQGLGKAGETAASTTDFVPFGPFSSGIVKQCGVGENVCQLNLNLNIYSTSAAQEFKANTVDISARKA